MSKAEKQPWLIFGDLRIEDEFVCHTKSSFEKNPRSREIRDACVAITRNLARFLWDYTLTQQKRQNLRESSKELGERLVALGIEPDIHVGRKPKTFWRSNVLTAEFIAGQLLPYTGYTPPSQQSLQHVISEFNHIDSGGYMIETEQTPKKLVDFWVDGWIVGNAIRELDCYEEVRFETYKEGLFVGQ